MPTPVIHTSSEEIYETVKREVIRLKPTIEVRRITTSRSNASTTVVESVAYTHTSPKFHGYFCLVEPSLLDTFRYKGWDVATDGKLIIDAPFSTIVNDEPYKLIRL